MITFLISLATLVLGYLVYGRFVERIFAPDDRVTPAVAQADGLDYVAMPYWKVFMIQFLNIAGTDLSSVQSWAQSSDPRHISG